MRILVVCQYYRPEPFRIAEICEHMVRGGHAVTVLTGLPNYPMGKVPPEYRWARRRNEVLNGVRILRSFEIGRRSGAIGLAMNYVSFMLAASLKMFTLRCDFDVVLVYQLSPVTMALPAVLMRWRARIPLLLYCLDIWPESVKSIAPDEGSLVFKVAKAFSRFLYSRCDAIVVTSQPFIEYFRKTHSIPIERLAYIPQFAEEVVLPAVEDSSDGVTNFVFMGNIGITQDIDCILDATEKIRGVPGFMVHFVGDGSYIETAKRVVQQRALDGVVVFHGRHSIEEMPAFYELADVCLLTLKADNFTGLTMPGKLQGYMAAGLPVIGAINGAARAVIDDSKCGVCVDAGDSDALANAMSDFVTGFDKYADCGRNGRAYYEKHFSKDRFMTDLESALQLLIEGESRRVVVADIEQSVD